MSDTQDDGADTAVPSEPERPWQGEGAVAPMESLYQHFKAEIARLEAKVEAMMGIGTPDTPPVEPDPAPVEDAPATDAAADAGPVTDAAPDAEATTDAPADAETIPATTDASTTNE